MACRVTPLPGGFAVFCGPRSPQKVCSVPGCGRPATKECDYQVAACRSGTCDAKLCDAHAVVTALGADHCPPHAKLSKREDQGHGG